MRSNGDRRAATGTDVLDFSAPSVIPMPGLADSKRIDSP